MAAPKNNQFAKGNDGGRPSKYKVFYPRLMLQYFHEGMGKNTEFLNKPYKNRKIVPFLPTFEKFGSSIGISAQRLNAWYQAKGKTGDYKYQEFREAYRRCREIQKVIIVENGLLRFYRANFAIFFLKNLLRSGASTVL